MLMVQRRAVPSPRVTSHVSRCTGVIVALAATAASPDRLGAAASPAAAAAARVPCRHRRRRPAAGDRGRGRGRRWPTATSCGSRAARTTATVLGPAPYDAATGTWGERHGGAPAQEPLLRRRRRPDGQRRRRRDRAVRPVRLLRGPRPPSASHALWSADTGDLVVVRARGRGLRGARHLPRRQQRGLARVRRLRRPAPRRDSRATACDTRGKEYTSTATITDQEQVSFLFGATDRPRGARLVVLTRDRCRRRRSDRSCRSHRRLRGHRPRQRRPGHRVARRPHRPRVPHDRRSRRPVLAVGGHRRSPRRAPRACSGRGRPRRRLLHGARRCRSSPSAPADRRRFRAQGYDPVSQTWGPTVLAYDAGARRCRWGDNWTRRAARGDRRRPEVRCAATWS